jgi:hypothetical protein
MASCRIISLRLSLPRGGSYGNQKRDAEGLRHGLRTAGRVERQQAGETASGATAWVKGRIGASIACCLVHRVFRDEPDKEFPPSLAG